MAALACRFIRCVEKVVNTAIKAPRQFIDGDLYSQLSKV